MDQKRVGKFIADLRREKNLTQEQLAEILGVNNRSVSRWENGHCMPDLSLLEIIAEELSVSILELLEGRRMKEESATDVTDSMNLILEWANREKKIKAKRVACCFGAGLLCFLLVCLQNRFLLLSYTLGEAGGCFTAKALFALGMIFEMAGFYTNGHDKMLTQKEMEVLLIRKGRAMMKTANEMMQFAGKYQIANPKQYKTAFMEVEKSLEKEEHVLFAALGDSYTRNELPMMWHVVLAVTEKRLIIGGDRMKGMIMVGYMNESVPLCDIISVSSVTAIMGAALILKTEKDELKIEEKNVKIASDIAKEIKKLMCRE